MISIEEFKARRQNVLNEMERNSAMILFAGTARKSSADEFHEFEVNRNFYYLTGIDQANSILVLVKSEKGNREFLFVDDKDPNVEKWLGIKLSTFEASEISGVKDVLITKTFDAFLETIFLNKNFGLVEAVYLDHEKDLKIGELKFVSDFINEVKARFKDLIIEDLTMILTYLRMVKSEAEIDMIREAINTTDLGLRNVLSKIDEVNYEYNIRDIFEFAVKEDDNSKLAFHTIVAGGKNATILHYPSAKDKLNKEDLVLLDLGAAKNYYSSDISRTYPLCGRFSDMQKEIYEIVLACNEATIKYIKPGVTIGDVKKFARDYLAHECKRHHLIPSEDKIGEVYYHGVSHHLGLDTHDIANLDRPLEKGMVITCEPGLYFKQYNIGVRIEDDILVTEKGSENLSKNIIKSVKDIEKYLASKASF